MPHKTQDERPFHVAHSTEMLSVEDKNKDLKRHLFHPVDRRPEILCKFKEPSPTGARPWGATPRLLLRHQRTKHGE